MNLWISHVYNILWLMVGTSPLYLASLFHLVLTINYTEGPNVVKYVMQLGLGQLCRHNFEHNRCAKASSIMPA